MVALYRDGFNLGQIGDKLHIQRRTVRATLARAGFDIPRRRRVLDLDESAFAVVTEESAYWIGFLMADGCVTEPRGEGMPSIRLSLAEEDAAHVERFKAFLKSSHKITVIKKKTSTFGGKEYNSQNAHTLVVHSKRLADALRSFGVTTLKTHTARVRGLELDRHFWRGVMDGDGSVHVLPGAGRRLRPAPGLNLCGSYHTLAQFVDFVHAHAPQAKLKIQRRPSISQVNMCGKYARLILSVLYSDCAVALDRKHQKALAILADFPARESQTPPPAPSL